MPSHNTMHEMLECAPSQLCTQEQQHLEGIIRDTLRVEIKATPCQFSRLSSARRMSEYSTECTESYYIY